MAESAVLDAARRAVFADFSAPCLAARPVEVVARLAAAFVDAAEFFAAVAVPLAPDEGALTVSLAPDWMLRMVSSTPSAADLAARRTSFAVDLAVVDPVGDTVDDSDDGTDDGNRRSGVCESRVGAISTATLGSKRSCSGSSSASSDSSHLARWCSSPPTP